jgi:hypothetical protein
MLCQATRRVAAVAVLCGRRRGHIGLHFDETHMMWWAGNDNRGIGPDGLTLQASDLRDAQDASTAARRSNRRLDAQALDLVAAWLNDKRLHTDPGTLEDMYAAIRDTGRHVEADPLRDLGTTP